MMKSKVTKKAVKDNYNRIIGIGYCDAQYLLNYSQPFAYSAGNNGWSCDYFDIDGICISTGYSPINNTNASYYYETLNKLNTQAQAIQYGNLDWKEKVNLVNELLKQFVADCTK